MKRIVTCVGTRPNLIKITQLHKELKHFPDFEHLLLHTGQHFDHKMNDVFFEELKLPKPDIFLGIEGGSQFEVMSGIMVAVEQEFKRLQPDLVLVPGDVNSSMICALVAQRMGIPVGHIESGLRSFDKSMPEEVNRIIIDQVASLFFVTEPSGEKHLIEEGFPKEAIHYVGNTMIDTLVAFEQEIDARRIDATKDLSSGSYALVTFHRPGNVDIKENLTTVTDILQETADQLPVVFPVHPRTAKNLEKFGLMPAIKRENIITTGPMGYLDFMHLVKNSAFVLTDSGGVQEETTFLQVPCLTVRPNTERPVTIDLGTNELVSLERAQVLGKIKDILSGDSPKGSIPDSWDGKATGRMLEAISKFFESKH